MRHRVLGAITAAASLLIGSPLGPAQAWAFPDYLGSRALGMGGGGRADARGGEAPLLNPAGMSLGRLYTLEGGYQFVGEGGGHLVHASVVDSTSAVNLAGGLYYNYRTAEANAMLARLNGHEAGLALSYPLGDHLLVGATAKYLHVNGGSPELDGRTATSGFTADAGAIVRAGSLITLGVTGYNLRDIDSLHAPVALGYGIAVNPITDFVLVVDALHDFTTNDRTRGVLTSVGGGAEYMFQHKMVVRAGGGRDGGSRHDYLAAGLAAVSELGAIDLGFRRDLTGDRKLTFFAAGLRMFIPQP